MSDERVADIVSAGRLRLGMFPSFMYVRGPGGEISGVIAELARALGERLGVEAELIEYGSPPLVVAALASGALDLALLGIDKARAGEVDFTSPLMRADFTYLVPPDSSVSQIADADQPDIRIAVVRNHAMDVALKGKLDHAQVVHVDVPDAAFALLESGEVEVAAGIRPGLLAYAARLAGSRVLADRYGANTLAFAVAKGRSDRLAWFQDFVTGANSSGLTRLAVSSAGLDGIDVAQI